MADNIPDDLVRRITQWRDPLVTEARLQLREGLFGKPASKAYQWIETLTSTLDTAQQQLEDVEEALDGEVVDKHPFFSKDLRGLLVRVEIKDAKWDRTQVLFLGKAPLLF